MAARSRSTQMIAAGAAMFVVAAALAILAMRGNDNNDSKDNASASAPTVTVQPAAESTPAPPAVTEVKIPTGKEALEVQLPAVQGLAGYAKTGDRVNVYGTFKDHQPSNAVKGAPLAKLILSNVEVLSAVNNGANVTYVLAVNPNEAEQVIYLSSFEGLWLTLVRDGAPSVGGTPGHNASNVS